MRRHCPREAGAVSEWLDDGGGRHEQTATLEHASYELQLLGSAFDDRLSWVTDLYWYHEDGYQNPPGDVLAGINAANPLLDLTAGWSGIMGTGFDLAADVKNVTEEYSLGGIQLYQSARPDIRPFDIVTRA